eukprot:2350028-Amphidinium_carterae.1
MSTNSIMKLKRGDIVCIDWQMVLLHMAACISALLAGQGNHRAVIRGSGTHHDCPRNASQTGKEGKQGGCVRCLFVERERGVKWWHTKPAALP